jgi:DUF971 family protein
MKWKIVEVNGIDMQSRPKNIAIDRNAALLNITWLDEHISAYPLRWVRANCPCATCREERRNAALNTDLLKLTSGPPPSTQVAGAELVGNYALRVRWSDGHDTGIYAFTALRLCCPCMACNPNGPPPLIED